jgi:hypothetical protein
MSSLDFENDITACNWEKCKRSKACRRFDAGLHPDFMQSYFMWPDDFDWKKCLMFWSNGKFKGEMRRLDVMIDGEFVNEKSREVYKELEDIVNED